jgi:hypothetical protein
VTAAQGSLFTEDELSSMRERTLDRVLDRLHDGDTEGAEHAVNRMFNEFESMHRLYRRWVAATLTFILERFGEDVLREAMDVGVDAWWTPNLRKLVEGTDDPAQSIRWFASGLRGHLVGLEIEEDEEKVVIQMAPCGSGGRLLAEGAYEGEDAFASLPGSPALTYGLADCPIYCAHQPAMERLAIARYGAPFVVIDPASYCTTRGPSDRVATAEDHCAFAIYKDPGSIPDRYYERLGLTPPRERERDDG